MQNINRFNSKSHSLVQNVHKRVNLIKRRCMQPPAPPPPQQQGNEAEKVNPIVQSYEKQAEIDTEKAKLDYLIQQQLTRVKAEAASRKAQILLSAEVVENQLRQRLIEQEANLESASNHQADDQTSERIVQDIDEIEGKLQKLNQLVSRQIDEVDNAARLSQAKLMQEQQRIDRTARTLQGQLSEFLREAPAPNIQPIN
eukprot:TRINITY_DN30562_c0_g2_i4.p1 TRINITY_DN30562_c0_g2~~TRINITY_DN30562_c0_g2_i4.p1  ORF type:complete len:226 (-),score=17.95 TRINITY_DN30562_c0_g2_i4:2-598(-)